MGIPGRRPNPTHLKIVNGNPGKRPLNHNEPASPPINPRPPREFDVDLKAIWRALLKQAPAGLLRERDREIVVNLCILIQRRRDPACKFGVFAQIRGHLAELGMTPSASSRMSVPSPAPKNPFADL